MPRFSRSDTRVRLPLQPARFGPQSLRNEMSYFRALARLSYCALFAAVERKKQTRSSPRSGSMRANRISLDFPCLLFAGGFLARSEPEHVGVIDFDRFFSLRHEERERLVALFLAAFLFDSRRNILTTRRTAQ